MKRAVVWFALLLIACAACSYADIGVGYSDTFSINNTAGPPEPVPSEALNPHTTSDGNLLRGQMHAHYLDDTCNSLEWYNWALCQFHVAEHSTPAELRELYASLGYAFVSITEHDLVTAGHSGDDIMGVPNCEEVTSAAGHVLAMGLNSMIEVDSSGPEHIDVLSRMIKEVHEKNGLAFIAHPNRSVVGNWKDLVKLLNTGAAPDGIAVYTAATIPYTNYNDGLWNSITERGALVWGFSEDDYAPGVPVAKSCAGRTWIAVPAPPGTAYWDDIRGRMTAGDFYVYWVEGDPWPSGTVPPQMQVSVTYPEPNRPRITVTVSGIEDPPSGTNWLSFIGRSHYEFPLWTRSWATYIPHDGSYTYDCNGKEKFIRVELELPYSFGKLKVSSQPIMVNKTGNPYETGALALRQVSATSPELILRYLQQAEKPVPPPAGYVGDAFDVSTATGELPPDATLQLSFDGEDTSAIGGTQYLAIYHYDEGASEWAKVGGTVDPGTATIESAITALGKYCISADLPEDTTAPEVFIDNPPCGSVVSTDTTVKATVNDDLGAWRVSFYMNDHLLVEDSEAMDFWTADITLADYCTGDWTLKAVAEDLAGNTGTAEIPIYIYSSTPPPTVSITTPSAGSTLTGTVAATGTCGDDVAVASIALTMNDTLVGYATVNGSDWTCSVDTTYLADGARTLTATVEDWPGNQASASVNVAVNNGASASPIGAIKQLDVGATARFSGGIVVAGPDLVDGGCYVESLDRASGIRVLTDRTVNKGDIVNVVGSTSTLGSEKVVQGWDVLVVSSGNELPRPIGMYGYRLFWPAPDSIGKIVKVWGNVISVDPSSPARWFVLDDGSGVAVKCTVPVGVTAPTTGLVAATGVCSVDPVSGAPVVLLSSQMDIETVE